MTLPNGIKFTLSAPGKVILHGEHSAVYSKLALAASLGLRTSLNLQESNNDTFEVHLPDIHFQHSFKLEEVNALLDKPIPTRSAKSLFNITQPEEIDHDVHLQNIEGFLAKNENYDNLNNVQKHALSTFLYLLVAMYGSLSVEIPPFKILMTSQLSIGAGTGSSASFVVCLAAALVHYVKMLCKRCDRSGNLSKDGYAALTLKSSIDQFDQNELLLISSWGYNGEKIHHGNPSGIDNTICTYGSLVAFKKGCTPERKKVSYPIKLMLINTKVSRNTKTLVEQVGDLWRKYPAIIGNILNAMDGISKNALTCIDELNDGGEKVAEIFVKLGELSEMNHGLLSVLGVSHPSLEQIIGIMRQHGLKGKLTGAGGGGYAICLVPPHFSDGEVEKVLVDLTKSGYDAKMTILGDDGVRVDT